MPRTTLADVAREAGVSVALVSIVMRDVPGASDATRLRVREIADRLGYVPDQRARKLRQSSSRLIGVTFNLRQPFHGDIVEHLYVAAEHHGYDLAISAVAPTRGEEAALEDLLRERCEVAILLGPGLTDEQLAHQASRVPSILVARRSEVDGVGSVRSDDVAGVELAVDHLVELGHRSLVHVDGGTAPGAADRRAGFEAAVARHGLEGRVVPGGPTEADGAEAMRSLLDSPATGILAFNDHCAAGVLHVLARARVDVPGDLSVIGYDDSRLAVGEQPMTTVSQDAAALAREAVENALAMIDASPARDVVLPPSLVVRSTSGPAPGHP